MDTRIKMADVVIMLKVNGTDKEHPMIFCPGCNCGHVFDDRWQWNQNKIKPTFTPSMLVNGHDLTLRCHSYVTDGKIQFLIDCAHDKRNTTVELRDFTIDEAIQ